MSEQLPSGSHTGRLCGASSLGNDGEVTAACFKPRLGTDHRPGERYLSVHWLEYLGPSELGLMLDRLRRYLGNSPISGERKPTRNGRIAVVPCDSVTNQAHLSLMVEASFRHEPRAKNVAPGTRIGPSGELVVGADEDTATKAGQILDPHSGLYTFPEEASHELAFQDLLAASVTYSEPGLL